MNSTKNFEVGGLLSSMSAHGVEKQMSRLPGVTAVAVNYVAGSASVSFEADKTTPEDIRKAIEGRRPRARDGPRRHGNHGCHGPRHGARRRHGRTQHGARHAQPLLGLPGIHHPDLSLCANGHGVHQAERAVRPRAESCGCSSWPAVP
jgi:Cu2+-exporting ATPase